LLLQIQAVTPADLKRVLSAHFKPLFDVGSSNCTIACHTSKAASIAAEFAEFGRNFTAYESLADGIEGLDALTQSE
jgi:hypothetical protein